MSATSAVQHAKPEVNWPVFLCSAAGIIAIALWAIVAPDTAASTLAGIVAWVSTNFGWFYILTATIAVVFMIFIACARTGEIKLARPRQTPIWAILLGLHALCCRNWHRLAVLLGGRTGGAVLRPANR